MGGGTNLKGVQGNLFAELSCARIRALRDRGKGWLFENQARRGMYPKVHDLPCFQRTLDYTKAVMIPGSTCHIELPGMPSESCVNIDMFPRFFLHPTSRG